VLLDGEPVTEEMAARFVSMIPMIGGSTLFPGLFDIWLTSDVSKLNIYSQLKIGLIHGHKCLKSKAIPVIGLRDVEDPTLSRPIGSQMAMKLAALRAGRALLLRNPPFFFPGTNFC
jgi:hypothetical protein